MLVSLRQQKGPNKTESQTSARQLVLVLFLQQGCNEADSVSVGGGERSKLDSTAVTKNECYCRHEKASVGTLLIGAVSPQEANRNE